MLIPTSGRPSSPAGWPRWSSPGPSRDAWSTRSRPTRSPLIGSSSSSAGRARKPSTSTSRRAGLDAEALARRSVEPSTMSLLGLVRHLAEVERDSFRNVMVGQNAPKLFCSDTDLDGDFNGAVADPDVVAGAWAAWRAEVDFA